MKTQDHGQVYDALADHQKSLASGWDMEELVRELHRWKEIFVSEFKLDLPPVAFCIKHTRALCYGYFRPGHNEFGLTREIAINKAYLRNRETWQILGTELHELLHAWQDANGKPGRRNYHNLEFCTMAERFGLLVDSRGVTGYAPEDESPFLQLLTKYGVSVPARPTPPVRTPGESKLKKWSCCCLPPVNVRVAVANFRAMCLTCDRQFVRQD